MKGLIKKDLYNLASYKTTLIIFVCFCVFGFATTESVSIIPILMCTIIGMISLSTFNYDASSKSDKFILSLPLTRKEIVLSKYVLAILSVFLGAILGFLFSILAVFCLNIIRPDHVISLNVQSLFISTIGGMFGISFIQSIQIPCVYKWGAEKGRIQMFLVIFAIILLIVVLSFWFMNMGISMDEKQIESFFHTYGIFLLLFLMIVMYTISYQISYRIFQKKDV